MLLTPARLLPVLMVVALVGCGPPDAEFVVDDPAAVRSQDPQMSDAQIHDAVTTALGAERLISLLASHPHHVEEVDPPDRAQSGVHVTVVFDPPVPDAAYPLDICAIDTAGQPITGLRWRIDDNVIVSVSPRWGEDRYCGDRPSRPHGQSAPTP